MEQLVVLVSCELHVVHREADSPVRDAKTLLKVLTQISFMMLLLV